MSPSTISAVNAERHSTLFWRAAKDFSFAAGIHVVQVAAQEMGHLARAFPLGFIRAEQQLTMVALLGYRPGQNLFVAPGGRWIGAYIPSQLRSHPFQLARSSSSSETVTLAVDEGSTLVGTDPDGAVPFFEGDTPHPKTKQMLEFLLQVRKGVAITQSATATLEAVLEPWSISIKEGEQSIKVEGVYCVAERKLNALDNEEFVAIRSALPLAYAQLLSMQNIQVFERLASLHATQREHQLRAEAKMFTPGMEDEKFDWKALFRDE